MPPGAVAAAGIKMRQTGSFELLTYWDELRAGRAAPERSDIDPGILHHILIDTFILEVDAAHTYPFGLSAPRLNALFGLELKGCSFLSLWGKNQKADIFAMLRTVTDDMAPVVCGAEAAPAGYEKAGYELLLLPLRHRGKTHARILGRMAPSYGPKWLGLIPAPALDFKSMRVLDTLHLAETLHPAHLKRRAKMPFERRGHLRIYTSETRNLGHR